MAYNVDHLLRVGDAKTIHDNEQAQINDLKSAITDITGNTSYAWDIGQTRDKGSVFTPSHYASWASVIVPCVEGDIFSVKGSGGGNSLLWNFVDVSGASLLASATYLKVSEYIQITAPENSAYIVCNTNMNDNSYPKWGLIKGIIERVAVSDNANAIVGVSDGLTDFQNDVGYSPDQFEKWDNYVVSVSDGSLYLNSKYISTKKAFSVNAGDTITLFNLPTGRATANIIFYTAVTDMGGTLLSYIVINDNALKSIKVNVPDGAKYFRFTCGFSEATSAGTVAPMGVYANYCYPINELLNPKLNVLVFGDSISDTQNITINDSTDTTTSYAERTPNAYYEKDGVTVRYSLWPTMLQRFLNVQEMRNYAMSGAHFYTSGNESDPRQKLLYQVEVAINDLDNPNNVFPHDSFEPDVIIVACGINETVAAGSYELTMAKTVMQAGNVGIDVAATMAALDQTNSMDAMRYVLMKIKQQFPTALLLYVNPLQVAYGTEETRNNSRDEFAKMARRYDFVNIDGFGEFGVVRDFETQEQVGLLTKDGLHPNEKGQNLYARNIIQAIKRYYFPLDKFNQ